MLDCRLPRAKSSRGEWAEPFEEKERKLSVMWEDFWQTLDLTRL